MTDSLDLETLCNSCLKIARNAGSRILEIYESEFDIEHKDDKSPLTNADMASHHTIVEALSALTPEIPILSEESAKLPFEERSQWRTYWLVDPLDGTREFIKRNGEFTVNIALVEGGVPTLGVVYAPVLERTYLAAAGKGAWRRDGDGEARPIRATGTGTGDGTRELAVVASRSHPSPRLEAFLDRLGEHRLVSMGSSLKLCLVAEGAADVYPRLGPTMEWDTAAGHAVLAGAGGAVIRFEAAVAGGIPVIKALTEGLAGNDITRVMGVMNGTCNYILTRMEKAGLSYEEAFAEADGLGYLEADPTLDVGGIENVQMGDEVVIFGQQGNETLSVDEMASLLNTINYEIVCNITARVPRVYLK